MTPVAGAEPDPEMLDRVPAVLADLLRETNGWIAHRGGLHVRGAVRAPAWHALRVAWEGPMAFHTLYPTVDPAWVPFAQDVVGDQFLLTADGATVLHLSGETGEVASVADGLPCFLADVEADPVTALGLQPLLRFEADGGALVPGQLLSVYPPFCTVQAADGVSIWAVPAAERLAFLADFAAQIAGPAQGR